MPVIARTVALLTANRFMTFAWYAHRRKLAPRPWLIAALASCGVALFEYLFQVPANWLGHTGLSLGQLRMLQEVITLTAFVPFTWIYMKEMDRLNDLWAAPCMCGAVFFMCRK